jgi:hypothetical protein
VLAEKVDEDQNGVMDLDEIEQFFTGIWNNPAEREKFKQQLNWSNTSSISRWVLT